MTLYCRNGHPQGENVVRSNIETGERKCPTCGFPLTTYVRAEHVPLWPVLLVAAVALLLAGGWWWWMWLAPH